MPASNRRLLTVLVEIESSNSFLMAVEVSCLFLKLSHFIHLSIAAVVFLDRPDLGFLAGDPVSLNLFSTFDTPDWVPPTLLATSHCLTGADLEIYRGGFRFCRELLKQFINVLNKRTNTMMFRNLGVPWNPRNPP